MKKRGAIVFITITFLIALLPTNIFAQESPKVVISSVKTGGVVAGEPTEFIELYNDSDTTVDLTGWLLEYAKPSAVLPDCNVPSWKIIDSSTAVKEIVLQGQILPVSSVVVEISMNDNAGGSLRLSNASIVQDLVGWGNTVSPAVCKETEQAPIPASTKSIKRHFDEPGHIIDTNNNSNDFADSLPIMIPPVVSDPSLSDVCSNLDGMQTLTPAGYVSNADGTCTEISGQLTDICKGVSVSEILPNPSGTDTGNEFIELFNSTNAPVSLEGCSLQVGTSKKVLTGVIQPGYQAFYGLVLPNAAGGTVTYVTPTTEDAVIYPADLQDDIAYALIDGEWQTTNQPTPNSANVANVEIAVVSSASTSSSDLAPCPDGKYRNPATNRCKNIDSSTSLTACDAGKVRNPDTNRCRNIDATLASLKACDPGQERNPATNRCKKVATTATLASCQEGQERNPDTNRCRKVAGATTSTANKDASGQESNKPNVSLMAMMLIASLALGYGVYEYRGNISNYFAKMRTTTKK